MIWQLLKRIRYRYKERLSETILKSSGRRKCLPHKSQNGPWRTRHQLSLINIQAYFGISRNCTRCTKFNRTSTCCWIKFNRNCTFFTKFNRNTIFDGNIYNRFLITMILSKVRIFKKQAIMTFHRILILFISWKHSGVVSRCRFFHGSAFCFPSLRLVSA